MDKFIVTLVEKPDIVQSSLAFLLYTISGAIIAFSIGLAIESTIELYRKGKKKS